ncbi:MAG: GDSL-type esterase/lipase family protein [Cytophagales bacterium]
MYWYNQDIEVLEHKEVSTDDRKKIVFYGSSTFTRWTSLEDQFVAVNAVNLGFGGSTLAACAWFFDRVVTRQKPDAIFIYAGDNDLGDGRTPEEVVLFYHQLLNSIRKNLGNVPVCFISIKLSPSRMHLKGSIEYANRCIRENILQEGESNYYLDLHTKMLDPEGNIRLELYENDGLHLSEKGYELWYEEIVKKMSTFLKT